MIENRHYVIDTHCHVYPDAIAEKAVASTDKFYGTIAKCNGTIDNLIKVQIKTGIDKSVIHSVATTYKQVASINKFLFNTIENNPNRFIPLGAIYPDTPNLDDDIKQIIDYSFHGIKMHPEIQGFAVDDIRCMKIFEKCEENNLTVLLHTGDKRYDFSNPNRLIPVLRAFPKLKFVGAHFGSWSMWDKSPLLLKDEPNLFVDVSSSFWWTGKNKGKELIKLFGFDKVMFASDYPMWYPGDDLNTILDMGFTDDELDKLLYENALKVYNIK